MVKLLLELLGLVELNGDDTLGALLPPRPLRPVTPVPVEVVGVDLSPKGNAAPATPVTPVFTPNGLLLLLPPDSPDSPPDSPDGFIWP